MWIRGPCGADLWKNQRPKILCYGPFKCMLLQIWLKLEIAVPSFSFPQGAGGVGTHAMRKNQSFGDRSDRGYGYTEICCIHHSICLEQLDGLWGWCQQVHPTRRNVRLYSYVPDWGSWCTVDPCSAWPCVESCGVKMSPSSTQATHPLLKPQTQSTGSPTKDGLGWNIPRSYTISPNHDQRMPVNVNITIYFPTGIIFPWSIPQILLW